MDPAGLNIEPGTLATFVAAVEYGTVGAAAEELALTQSAATKRIQRLERRLGVALLERDGRGVTTTLAGQALYPEAKQVLEALQRAATVARGHDQVGRLRMSASHTIGGYLLPRWITSFRLDYGSDVRASVDIQNSVAVLRSVNGGRVDIGFIESPDDEPDPGLDTITLLENRIVVVVAPRHPWSSMKTVAPQALEQEPYFAREVGSGTRAVAIAALKAVGYPEPTPTIETTSTQSLKRAVLDGGFTLLSRVAVEAEIDAGALSAIAVDGVDFGRSLRAVRRRHPAPMRLADRFWAHLRTRVAHG
jgi:DNA-binding transcriptional LysR family regulator